MKQNKTVKKQTILQYAKQYVLKEQESIYENYCNPSFKINDNNFYISLYESLNRDYLYIEDFFVSALFNTLEDMYKDEYFDYYISEIKIESFPVNKFNSFLKNTGIVLNVQVDYLYAFYNKETEKIFSGRLIDGNFFSLAVLNN